MHSFNNISYIERCDIGLRETSKSNGARNFVERRQGRWVFFIGLKLEPAVVYVKNLHLHQIF